MSRICFVTNELYPSTIGGIGRLIHNLIEDGLRHQPGDEYHLVVPSDSFLSESPWGARVPLHRATRVADKAFYPPPEAFDDTVQHARSLEIMIELARLEAAGLNFEVIEFCDYLGWAFCSTQQKRLGLAFTKSTLRIRLHGTASLISSIEGGNASLSETALMELERKSLEDADEIVAHVSPVIDRYHSFYGFSNQWRDAVRVAFPPVLTERASLRVERQEHPNLVFTTKVQGIKRPDLFVRAAAQLMLSMPSYQGRAVLACHGAESPEAAQLAQLVPLNLKGRFLFTRTTSQKGRHALVSGAIVVIPSDFESLSLAAYEAADDGATLVLNGMCPAFEVGSPFVDGENCHLFDGSVDGLVKSLRRAIEAPHPKRVEWLPQRLKPKQAKHPKAEPAEPLVSVIVTNFNLAEYLPRALRSVQLSTYRNLEIIVVDDASTNEADRALIDSLQHAPRIKIMQNDINRGLAASRNIGVSSATGQYVLPLDADDCVHPRFIQIAVTALEAQGEFDVVTPTSAYFKTDDDLAEHRFVGHQIFLGNASTLGMIDNRLSSATSLMRRSLFNRFRYDERLDSYEDWSLYLRMSHQGIRFLVSNEIGFFYRKRTTSMIHGIDRRQHQRLLALIWGSLPKPLPSSVRVEALPLLLSWWNAPEETERPMRYVLADKINDAAKSSPLVHRALKSIGAMSTAKLFGRSRSK